MRKPVPVLHAPAPNPASGHVRLAFDLAAPGHIRLSLFDMLGREGAVLAGGFFPASRYETFLDVAGLATGAYVLRLTADGFTHTRLLSVVR